MTVQSYQEFQVWNVAMDLATECYRISQMRSRPTPHAPRPTPHDSLARQRKGRGA